MLYLAQSYRCNLLASTIVWIVEEIDTLHNPDCTQLFEYNWINSLYQPPTMCDNIASPPIRPEDLQMLGEYYPNHTRFINAAYAAVNDGLHPHYAVLPALTVMFDHHTRGQFGLLCEFEAVRLPLSIVGASNTRWRTKTVRELHDAFLPFAMAGRNCNLIEQVCRDHGVVFFRDCSCGLVMTSLSKAAEYANSAVRKCLNAFRSSLDRIGAPVKDTCCLNDIPEETMDLTPGERSMFKTLGELLRPIRERRKLFDPNIFAEGNGIPESKERLFKLASAVRGEVVPV